MVTDRELLRQLHKGHGEALHHVYERYKDAMLALALALSRDRSAAEDVVHDVFVSFAGSAPGLHLRSSLRSYLLTGVANRVRSLKRRPQGAVDGVQNTDDARDVGPDPVEEVITAELLERAYRILGELAYEQRETIVLRLQAGLSFRKIARVQGVPLGTALSRYRYGLDRLRRSLNREAAS